MATVFRAPVLQRIERPANRSALTAQDEVWQNLLSTLLAVPVPFTMLEWPNPRRFSPPSRQDEVWQNLLSTLLAAAAPFTMLEWPNPGRFSPASRQDEVWQNLLSTLLTVPAAADAPRLRRRRR